MWRRVGAFFLGGAAGFAVAAAVLSVIAIIAPKWVAIFGGAVLGILAWWLVYWRLTKSSTPQNSYGIKEDFREQITLIER